MALSIQNNIMSLMAGNNLAATYNLLSKSVNSLSSGLRINGAADDAAGLAVRELMRSDIAVLKQGIRNANDAISMLQTMDGAASVIDEKLIRMKELAEQAATGTYTDAQRAIMNDEFDAMRDEIDRIANATDFNGTKMLNASSALIAHTVYVTANSSVAEGTAFISAFTGYTSGEALTILYTDHDGTAGALTSVLQLGDSVTEVVTWINAQSATTGFSAEYSSATGRLTFEDRTSGASRLDVDLLGGASYSGTVGDTGSDGRVKIHFGTGNDSDEDYYYAYNQNMTAAGLGINSLSIATQGGAQAALETLDDAIKTKDEGRAHFGAVINRLENTVTNLTIQAENIQAAESQISDVDVAFEMSNFLNLQIKAQAAVAMLAQANMLPQLAMQLMGG